MGLPRRRRGRRPGRCNRRTEHGPPVVPPSPGRKGARFALWAAACRSDGGRGGGVCWPSGGGACGPLGRMALHSWALTNRGPSTQHLEHVRDAPRAWADWPCQAASACYPVWLFHCGRHEGPGQPATVGPPPAPHCPSRRLPRQTEAQTSRVGTAIFYM